MSEFNPVYIIKGGTRLNGSVTISSAKNAAVAIIPATVLVSGTCRVSGIGDISDNRKLFDILQKLGATFVKRGPGCYDIDCTNVRSHVAVSDAMRRIRASYYLAGALLGKFGRCDIALPGGCDFGGLRPIDQHIKGFTAMGAEIDIKNGILTAATNGGLHNAHIMLDGIPSVGATINIMLAAVLTPGLTVIGNAAREPHIVDTAQFLNQMGADIRGAGTDEIKIHGGHPLTGGEHTIIPDQIEAGTFMVASAVCGGTVELNNVIPRHLEVISQKLREIGADVDEYPEDGRVVVTSSGHLYATDIKTMPYPGFPTDMQPQFTTALCLAEGTSRVTDVIFESRFRYLPELEKMGAHCHVSGNTATVEGVRALTGAPIKATDLRAGAALVIAGLAARGTTRVEGIEYVDRGYERFVEKLQGLGADIRRVDGAEKEITKQA